jgi:hypothetical protein
MADLRADLDDGGEFNPNPPVDAIIVDPADEEASYYHVSKEIIRELRLNGKVAIVAATEAGHNLACTKGPSACRFRAEFLLESPLLLNLVHRRFKNWQKNGRLSRRFQSLRLVVA